VNRLRKQHRAGQAMIFIVMVVVILFFVVLWNFDLHKTLYMKLLSQNGGDAAALMAARWQGITLNVVGDLNIMQALALSASDPVTLDSISNIQARLAYVGPMIAFMASQQAAKNNRAFQNDEFSVLIREHADTVRYDYTTIVSPDGGMLFPEPYEGAWEEYADMLELVAEDGVAAAPENARYYTDYAGGHMLLSIAFYDAVLSRDWCWFFHNALDVLEDYTDYTWWPDLPPVEQVEYINSEIYGLGFVKRVTSADSLVDADTLTTIAAERDLETDFTPLGLSTTATWYCYGGNWTAWTALAQDTEYPFPVTGPVRPQYDYSGADAAVRIHTRAARFTPNPGGGVASNAISWTAAAKPFGYLEEETPPHAFGLVLPAYHDVRLIALDASSTGSGGGFEICWRRHIETYLPAYLESGPSACTECRYCDALRIWEDPAFRAEGLAWLAANSADCIAPPGGGGGGGPGRRTGGRRRGH